MGWRGKKGVASISKINKRIDYLINLAYINLVPLKFKAAVRGNGK